MLVLFRYDTVFCVDAMYLFPAVQVATVSYINAVFCVDTVFF